jgi:hypothetical protein
MVGEMVRVDALLDAGLPPQQNFSPSCGDPGWGKEGGNVDNVHFDTSIAKSFYALEKTALQRRPGLRQRDARSIREYVSNLRKAFPSLKASLCDEYLHSYERAVFGDHKASFEEYNRFTKIVMQIVASINEKGYGQQQQFGVGAGAGGMGGMGGFGAGGGGMPGLTGMGIGGGGGVGVGWGTAGGGNVGGGGGGGSHFHRPQHHHHTTGSSFGNNAAHSYANVSMHTRTLADRQR